MSLPKLTKRRIVAAKVETTPGTAVALTNTDAFYASDIKYSLESMVTSRKDDATLGNRTMVVGAKKAKIEFSLEVRGSGTTGTSPHWALILLPALGLKESTGTWTPSSTSSDWKTLTVGVYEDGLLKEICGAMGSAKIEGEDGKPLKIMFTFEGVYVPPTDTAMLTPEADTVKPQPFIGTSFAYGTSLAPVSKVSFEINNQVYVREDVSQTHGYLSAVITDREITGSLDPEATALATRNLWTEFSSQTEASFSFTIGSGGNGCTITAPKVQIKSLTDGDRNGIVTHDLGFQMNKNSGDDEISIAF